MSECIMSGQQDSGPELGLCVLLLLSRVRYCCACVCVLSLLSLQSELPDDQTRQQHSQAGRP